MEKFVAVVARLRGIGASIGPYLVLAIVVPGGSLMAPLLYLQRRRRQR